MLDSARLGAVVVLCLAPLMVGCSHDYGTLGSGTGGTGACPVGDETCACFPNDTCQTGLICASSLCVRLGGTGAGGSAGAGGSVGPGGSPGSGGSVGPGGSPGSGGNIGPGGSVGSGGNVGPGGSVGSGGSVGPGGSPGSGGVGPGGSIGSGGNIGPGGSVGSGGSVVIGSGGAVGSGGASGGPNPPANNQIVNGDFSSGSSAPWHVTNYSGTTSTDTTSIVTNGQFCVTEANTYTAFNIGWPTTSSPVAALQSGTTYEFYYQISTSAPLYSFSAKVGSAPGGTANLTHLMTSGTQGEPTAGAGLQTFAFTFAPTADPTAGVVFLLYSGASPTTVCIDNVALGTLN